jgi:hypothetical protein
LGLYWFGQDWLGDFGGHRETGGLSHFGRRLQQTCPYMQRQASFMQRSLSSSMNPQEPHDTTTLALDRIIPQMIEKPNKVTCQAAHGTQLVGDAPELAHDHDRQHEYRDAIKIQPAASGLIDVITLTAPCCGRLCIRE